MEKNFSYTNLSWLIGVALTENWTSATTTTLSSGITKRPDQI
jgi:hypothetical protein